MTAKTRGADNTGDITRRARALRNQAKRLREKAGEIREVLVVNDPLTKRSSVYRGSARLIDVLDRILDSGIRMEPWRRVTLSGIELSNRKVRLTTTLIQTHLVNKEIVACKRKRFRSPPFTGPPLASLRPANFLDMLDRILDKGIVVDSWQHIREVGIDVLGVEAHAHASVQTHLLYENQQLI